MKKLSGNYKQGKEQSLKLKVNKAKKCLISFQLFTKCNII